MGPELQKYPRGLAGLDEATVDAARSLMLGMDPLPEHATIGEVGPIQRAQRHLHAARFQ